MAPRFVIHAASRDDLEDVTTLARHLDTVNLPDDRAAIESLLERSEQSFSGAIGDPTQREYVFVLRDQEADRVVGTSMIVAQLGRRGSPYTYLDVDEVEKYSATLDRHFVHTVLTVRYSYDGPTEIGGLVVHPDYRRREQRLGTLIAFVRFLFLATRPAEFQPTVLAELLPPLTEDGSSHLWEALGRRFTGLTYAEADRLSKTNKEFIRGLFPVGEIYATLLSEQAQDVIGKVGPGTQGVQQMLQRIGFSYARRVDPFDGGPHYVAPLHDIRVVADSGQVELFDDAHGETPHLVARVYTKPPYLLACEADALSQGDGRLGVPREVRKWLDAAGQGATWATPLAMRNGQTGSGG